MIKCMKTWLSSTFKKYRRYMYLSVQIKIAECRSGQKIPRLGLMLIPSTDILIHQPRERDEHETQRQFWNTTRKCLKGITALATTEDSDYSSSTSDSMDVSKNSHRQAVSLVPALFGWARFPRAEVVFKVSEFWHLRRHMCLIWSR